MVTFKVWLLLGATCAFQSAEALICHTCNEYSEDNCLDDPANSSEMEVGQPPSGKDYYCYTEFRTIVGKPRVNRNFEATSENLDGVVKEGPYNGTRNPEENYIHVSYCKTDRCNTHLYIPPPKVPSTIKCYVCGSSDGDCAVNVASKYLIDADPFPNRKTSKRGALNTTKGLRSFADEIAPFELETYCETRFLSDGDVNHRGVEWFKKGEWEDGKCRQVSPEGVKACYCKRRDGCNDENGSEGLRASFFAVTFLFVLTNQVLLWGK